VGIGRSLSSLKVADGGSLNAIQQIRDLSMQPPSIISVSFETW
jgi:hypothetical protein